MRSVASLKNIISGILLQLITIILGIGLRKVLLDNLGLEYFGLNAVLGNVISMLGLAELGIGLAISYSLYEPLAKGNKAKASQIMRIFSKFYRIVAIVVFTLGILFFPLLKYFINSNIDQSVINTAYILFVVDSVSTYLLAYRRTILIADQKKYIVNNFVLVGNIAIYTMQALVLVLFKNYFLFVSLRIILNALLNLSIYIYTSKKYTYITGKIEGELDYRTRRIIYKNIKALFLANISVYMIFGTDNLLISFFIGTSMVGIYSNYALITNAVKSLISQVFLGITASYGNLLVKDSKEKVVNMFNSLLFLNFWLSTFSSICLFILLNPFIEIWLGKDIQLSIFSLLLIVVNFHLDTMRSSIELVKSAAGLYSPYPFYKYWIALEAIINLVFSIIFVKVFNLGINGVFLGTTLSCLFSTIVFPMNVYKYVFKESSMIYYFKIAKYFIITFIFSLILYIAQGFFTLDNIYFDFILKMLLCIVMVNLLIIIAFFKTDEFKFVHGRIKNIIYTLRSTLLN